MAKIYFAENDDILDICKDNVFKAVFTKDIPESQKALGRLVSALVGRELSIIAINANEPPIDNLRDRQIRFDINCKAENGELINVEMGLDTDPFELVRLEYHVGKLFIGQDIRGKDINGNNRDYNDLKQAYQIAILAKRRFLKDEIPLHAFEYYDPLHNVSLNGRSRIITLELSKLGEVVKKPIKDMNASELWGVYFRYLRNKKKRGIINEIIEYEEGIAMASQVLITISKDEEEQAWLRSREKYILDTQSKVVHARRQGEARGMKKGLTQGHAEGHAEEKLEIARKMKAIGRPSTEIAEVTGLTVDEVTSTL
jgi:predicted transposase/invertase (TIGR01784 family)